MTQVGPSRLEQAKRSSGRTMFTRDSLPELRFTCSSLQDGYSLDRDNSSRGQMARHDFEHRSVEKRNRVGPTRFGRQDVVTRMAVHD